MNRLDDDLRKIMDEARRRASEGESLTPEMDEGVTDMDKVEDMVTRVRTSSPSPAYRRRGKKIIED